MMIKINFSNIKQEVENIIDVYMGSAKLQNKYFDFDIKKKKSNVNFSRQNQVILEAILPLMIFVAMCFFLIKDSKKLKFEDQETLESIFKHKIKSLSKDFENNKEDARWKHIENTLLKYKKFFYLEKHKISSRVIHFNSTTKEHKYCLGYNEQKTENIVIKFRGIKPEGVHIRICIIIEKIDKIYKFILQDIVNKKDRN